MSLEKIDAIKNNSEDNEAIQACDINELAKTMTQGIRRWEKVIYPMMVAFIILAAYGFWLIYNVTKDMRQISNNMIVMTKAVVTMTNTLNQKMNNIDAQLTEVNQHMAGMDNLDNQLTKINASVLSINESLIHVDSTLTGIHQSVQYMGYSTSSMSGNLSELNHNISAPMNSMNSMIPWANMPGGNKRNNAARLYPTQPYPQMPYAPQPMPVPQAANPTK